jgi:hypothetical protein
MSNQINQPQQLNDKIKALSKGVTGEYLVECLDEVISHIADARNGSWSVETRLASIEALKEVLYNKVKAYQHRPTDDRTGSEDMI